ncbi:hypothetical protein D3C78_1076620 [compost metagenome]
MGEILHLLPLVPSFQWHQDVHALAAAGLEEARQPQLIEQGEGQAGGLDHPRPGQGRVWIEVENEAVGALQIG